MERRFPGVIYVPESSRFSLADGAVVWEWQGEPRRISLRPERVYMLPSGYRLRLEKQLAGTTWRLTSTSPQGTLCHKPATVSRGGKSKIAKSVSDLILKGPVFVKDYGADMDEVEANRWLRDLPQTIRQLVLSSLQNDITSRNGANIGASTSAWTASTAFWDTSSSSTAKGW